ncbi:MAG: hypothetical protein HUK06_06785 [Bacteroidaceae bacterium]|nr:hypothetical protein [Bacteroidaceae bacterium]
MKNTNRIRLSESQLHSVIKESIKQVLQEKYGTPPNNDIMKFDNLRNGGGYAYRDFVYSNGTDSHWQSDTNSYRLQQAEGCFAQIMSYFALDKSNIGKAIYRLAERGIKMTTMCRKKAQMELGIPLDSDLRPNFDDDSSVE